MAEEATHHLLRVLLSIPVLPVEFFDTLLDHLLTLSLCRMETFLHTCATAMESAGSSKHFHETFESSLCLHNSVHWFELSILKLER